MIPKFTRNPISVANQNLSRSETNTSVISADPTAPIPPYVGALVQQGQYRWRDRPLGQPITLTYNFMEELPAYYKPKNGRWDSGTRDFKPMTEAQREGVKLALQEWSNISGITFRPVSNRKSAQLRFGTAVDAKKQFLGWAYSPGTGIGQWSGDMWLNHQEPSNRNPTPGSYGFSTILHEIGHALGLSHPFDEDIKLPKAEQTVQYTVMAYDKHPDLPERYQPAAPMLYDVAAIQYLYGKNPVTNGGNTVYRWQPGEIFIKTIEDVSGIDTISARNQQQNVVVNLQAGQFSSMGEFRGRLIKNNLTIGFGVTIENAIGGTGDDTLIGNEVANGLLGNDGADTLIGLAGNDRLTGGFGDDRFVFQTASDGIDSITDFAQGNDLIDVSLLLSQIGYTGADPLSEGIIIPSIQQGNTVVLFDRDGFGGIESATPLAILENFTNIPYLNSAIKFIA